MALGKNSRVEARKSSNYYSTISVVVFVAFCLLGIWIIMSSIAPFQNSDLHVSETINEMENIVGQNSTRKFENSSNDLLDESTKLDREANKSQSENHLENQEDQKAIGEVQHNTAEEDHQEVVIRESSDEKDDSYKGSRNTFEGNYQETFVTPSSKEKDFDRNLNSESVETESLGSQTNDEKKFNKNVSDNKLGTEKNSSDVKHQDETAGETEEGKIKYSKELSTGESIMESNENSQASKEAFSAVTQSGTLTEATTENGTWFTQAAESQHEKESQKSLISSDGSKYEWKLCNTTTGPEYIPCLDNWQAIRKLPGIRHYEHRERHCPDEAPTCLVPLPEGYRSPIKWPKSRDMVSDIYWNWMTVTFVYLTLKLHFGSHCRYGTIMHHIQSLQKLRVIKTGSKLLGNTLVFLEAELSLNRVLFIT